MLIEKINEDLKKALKEKENLTLLVLRGVNSAIHNKEIEKRGEKLSDEEIIEILMSEVKKRKEAIEEFTKGRRNDLVEKEQKELNILKKYLPEQMSKKEIKEEAQKIIEKLDAVGPEDTGKVMGALMPNLKGRAEGKLVSKIVSDLLKN